jgi:hypothetical protein
MELDLSDVTLCAADGMNLAAHGARFAHFDGEMQIRRDYSPNSFVVRVCAKTAAPSIGKNHQIPVLK